MCDDKEGGRRGRQREPAGEAQKHMTECGKVGDLVGARGGRREDRKTNN